jgi:hypothetical protein
MTVKGERQRVRDVQDVSSVRSTQGDDVTPAIEVCYKPNNFISLPSRFTSKYPFHLVHYKVSIYDQVPRCVLVMLVR